jgi:hypothetical protein
MSLWADQFKTGSKKLGARRKSNSMLLAPGSMPHHSPLAKQHRAWFTSRSRGGGTFTGYQFLFTPHTHPIMNSLHPFPVHARCSHRVSASMPHTVLNSCGILPVRRPHAALLARAQLHVKRPRSCRRLSNSRTQVIALDY